MDAAAILDTLRAAGLHMTPAGENIEVRPRERLTPELRQIIKSHKADILDALADDRRHCESCANLSGRRCEARRLFVLDDLPRRCLHYKPKPGDPDQRTGAQRWPALLTPLEE